MLVSTLITKPFTIPEYLPNIIFITIRVPVNQRVTVIIILINVTMCQLFFQVTQMKDIHLRWFRIEPWKRWCHSLLLKITEGSLGSPAADEDMGESPAFEVSFRWGR
jgi:hypothetical protein